MTSFGSVCSGISAASVAWGDLGFKAAWFAEVDPFASSVLKHHYPHVPNMGDMTQLAPLVRAGLIEAPDVLEGGTPCQAFSVAGARAGLLDPRGQLTLSFADLANAIDEKRPGDECVIVWENVPGVLSDKSNAFGCFLGILAGEDEPLVAPGGKWPNAGCVVGPQRTIAWRVTDAQYFGVAQRRRRVFLVASARDGFDPTEILFEFDGLRRDTAPSRQAREDVTGTISSRTTGGGGLGTDFELGGRLQAVAYGGNNQSGPIDIATARNACSSGTGRLDFETETFLVQSVVSTLDASYGRLQGCSGQDMNRGHSHLVPIAFDSRQDCVSSPHVFGALGSSSPQALAICITGDITHTLKAEGFDASEDGTRRGQPIVAALALRGREGGAAAELGDDCGFTLRASTGGGDKPHALVGMAVRRLTPRECERLQAFPDDYTLVPHRGKPAADGPRYKALGNSMCTSNMRWIGKRLLTNSSITA